MMDTTDDGMIVAEVGAWAEQKYNLLYTYLKMFSTAMFSKWDARVYIDLFASSGKARLKGTSRIVCTSPLLAVEVPDRFDKYIFCDINQTYLDVLEHRIHSRHPGINAEYICGDVNANVDIILQSIPSANRSFKVLSFCFADPYNAKNLCFNTIKSLSKCYMDFLILLPTHMDINRNKNLYMRPGNDSISSFVGTSYWKNEWAECLTRNILFEDFFSRFYRNKMIELGYCYGGYSEIIRNNKNSPLYKLGFFSRHILGEKFWKETLKYSTPQISLFDN